MRTLTTREAYRLMYQDYPDVVDIHQMREMLGGIGEKTAYKLLRDNTIPNFKIGRAYRIPKVRIIDYIQTTQNP